jgi:hypothetical protein
MKSRKSLLAFGLVVEDNIQHDLIFICEKTAT